MTGKIGRDGRHFMGLLASGWQRDRTQSAGFIRLSSPSTSDSETFEVVKIKRLFKREFLEVGSDGFSISLTDSGRQAMRTLLVGVAA